ncbi:hypothetical protein L6452_36684 [Arctium lappa]|uniref:Uncharacterized protein n=1 Tax=Arctium lappa TaxID=4217 RepID=A0ACB8YB15_ARCLA|nr:hypothetical protein L6452_36684 [Arctium lappa]
MSHELTCQQISKLDLPHKILCRVVDSSLKVDPETDEVFAIIKLHPFEEVDLSQPQPTQELVAKDLHGHTWRFMHVYRGSPRRHIITSGWTKFVASKRLAVGDTLFFVRHSNNELGIGIRRSRQQIPSSSSILSRESMHLGVLASASHSLYTNKEFVVYYNPRHTGVALEETDISEEWPGSTWRSIKVQWNEPAERFAIRLPTRMSRWQLEPIEDVRSDVSELEAESSSSRHKRLRISDHGPLHRANVIWGDSLHLIPSSSTALVDKGKECENPQVLRLFGVDIQLVGPYSSGRIMVQMQGNVLVRTVDPSSLGGYEELKNELEKMFKIQGEIHGREKWEIVYEDGEGDLMLLGDKPWREFCKIVKKIMIRASDYEMKKMIDLGFKIYFLQ